jgi:hypothetical protein
LGNPAKPGDVEASDLYFTADVAFLSGEEGFFGSGQRQPGS